MTSDTIHMLAVLALDVRPSSVNVQVEGDMVFHIEVLRHETIGRHFDSYVSRFRDLLERKLIGVDGDVTLSVVDELSQVFERQEAVPIRLKVGD